jgi:phosphotransferase system HPr-like phosphotransfer protein
MVEAFTAAAAAGVVMKYVLPAIRDLGEKVLEASEDSVSNAVVGFGKRLLRALLGRRAQADQSIPEVVALRKGIERRVLVLARGPAQQKAASQLEGAIEDLLMADSSLLASIAALLEKAPEATVRQGDRSSYVGRDNSGTVITGDGNSVRYGSWP